MTMNMLPAIHPGEILREEYMAPLNMTAYALAKKLHVPRTRIERIIAEKTAISPDTALRLAKFFNTTAQFWLNMQNDYELKSLPDDVRNDISTIHQLEAAE